MIAPNDSIESPIKIYNGEPYAYRCPKTLIWTLLLPYRYLKRPNCHFLSFANGGFLGFTSYSFIDDALIAEHWAHRYFGKPLNPVTLEKIDAFWKSIDAYIEEADHGHVNRSSYILDVDVGIQSQERFQMMDVFMDTEDLTRLLTKHQTQQYFDIRCVELPARVSTYIKKTPHKDYKQRVPALMTNYWDLVNKPFRSDSTLIIKSLHQRHDGVDRLIETEAFYAQTTQLRFGRLLIPNAPAYTNPSIQNNVRLDCWSVYFDGFSERSGFVRLHKSTEPVSLDSLLELVRLYRDYTEGDSFPNRPLLWRLLKQEGAIEHVLRDLTTDRSVQRIVDRWIEWTHSLMWERNPCDLKRFDYNLKDLRSILEPYVKDIKPLE